MSKRKGLCGLSAREVLDIVLTSLDCGRDCCGTVSGGCSNVGDSMMREGTLDAILEAGSQICSNSGSTKVHPRHSMLRAE